MCLTKNKRIHPFNRPLIAKEDIICYKKLAGIWGTYTTPCTYVQVPIECIRDKVPFKAQIFSKFQFIWDHILGFDNEVEGGFIHSYIDNPFTSDLYATFKCIIPKGTRYFVGRDGDYASEQIIFVEQLQ